MSERRTAKAKIIAFSGAHGTGKSTAAYAMAARLKRIEGGEVGLLMEVAHRCPYPILGADDEEPQRESQMWIFAEQIRAELEAVLLYDVVVCDRTIVDSIAYSSVCGFHDLAAGQIALARHHVGIYREIIFHGAAEFPVLREDGRRNVGPKMQAEVQARMLELYCELGIKIRRAEMAGNGPGKVPND